MIACYRCIAGTLKGTSPSTEDMRSFLRDERTILWVDFESPTEEELELLNTVFGFHPLAVEDCAEGVHTPKIDDFRRYLFVILRTIVVSEKTLELDYPEIDLFLGKHFLVTLHRTSLKGLTDFEDRIKRNPEDLIGRGADRLLAALLESIVDRYLATMEIFDERIADIEDEVFDNPTAETLQKLFRLKRQTLNLRRVLVPQREILRRLGREIHSLITEEYRVYFWDTYDHLVRLAELLEYYRDLISGALDAYLSVISNRINNVMKTLTVIATIMMPLTLIASIYGMNFHVMPGLEMSNGFHLTLGAMGIIATVMLILFKWKRWFW
ncbi:MAG: magnesium/cobalt transporter CorA [Candidatus Latescibacteria bacterium]|nr:magnesium/cobalt transporter CorA [Candidatus Latescibacterota bacterium]